MKLTNVVRASLEELRRDYEDFLRQRELAQWPPDHPALERFKVRRCSTLGEVRAWVEEEMRRTQAEMEHRRAQTNTDGREQTQTNTDEHRQDSGDRKSVSVGECPCRSSSSAELAANGALSLLNLCCFLLDRQLAAQAAAFEQEGGFTERLFRVRSERRRNP